VAGFSNLPARLNFTVAEMTVSATSATVSPPKTVIKPDIFDPDQGTGTENSANSAIIAQISLRFFPQRRGVVQILDLSGRF